MFILNTHKFIYKMSFSMCTLYGEHQNRNKNEKVMTCYHLSYNNNTKYSSYSKYCAISQLNFVCLTSMLGFWNGFLLLNVLVKVLYVICSFSGSTDTFDWIWVTYVIMDKFVCVTKHPLVRQSQDCVDGLVLHQTFVICEHRNWC